MPNQGARLAASAGALSIPYVVVVYIFFLSHDEDDDVTLCSKKQKQNKCERNSSSVATSIAHCLNPEAGGDGKEVESVMDCGTREKKGAVKKPIEESENSCCNLSISEAALCQRESQKLASR